MGKKNPFIFFIYFLIFRYGDSPFMSRSSSDKVFKDLASSAKPPLDLYSMVSTKENKYVYYN